MRKKIIFDIETNGLLDSVTKIHCLSYLELDVGEVKSLTDYKEIKELILSCDTLIGHNIILYDIPVLEKILDFELPNSIKTIDTLGLSWYLYDKRKSHGLELWGKELGVEKPFIADWKNLSITDYINRCESDVKINTLLYQKQMEKLKLIYENNEKHYMYHIGYINFILNTYKHHYKNPIKLDLPLIYNSIDELEVIKEEKVKALISVMPRKEITKVKKKPKVVYKKDGSLSSNGQKWVKLLEEQNLPLDYEDDVEVFDHFEEGNPNSPEQVKDWLYMLGWVPRTFSESTKTDGTTHDVPQVYNDKKEVCDSVKELYHIEPKLENLDQLSLVKHRLSIFKGFLRDMDENGYLRAEMRGLAPTYRVQHSKIVNLPKPFKFFGDKIRGSFIIPDENHIMCGFDLSNIEDRTKRHYIYPYDPEYVEELRDPNYDAHTNLGVLASLITEDEEKFYKWFKNGKK